MISPARGGQCVSDQELLVGSQCVRIVSHFFHLSKLVMSACVDRPMPPHPQAACFLAATVSRFDWLSYRKKSDFLLKMQFFLGGSANRPGFKNQVGFFNHAAWK